MSTAVHCLASTWVLLSASPNQGRDDHHLLQLMYCRFINTLYNPNYPFNHKLQWRTRQCGRFCLPHLYLRFHGIIFIFLLFVFVLKNGNTLFPEECGSGTDWGCSVKSLSVPLPFMASHFRHAPSCSVQLFITYDTSNMISRAENNSSQHPSYIYPASPDVNENKNSQHGCACLYMTNNCKRV